MKTCNNCKIEKPLTSFHKRNNRPCGTRNICKDCYKTYNKKRRINYMRNYDLKKSYNITIEDYNQLLINQDNKCKICGKQESSLDGRKKYLCVDHDHNTNKIRGLLCDNCNRGLGLFWDSIELLNNSIKYLEENK